MKKLIILCLSLVFLLLPLQNAYAEQQGPTITGQFAIAVDVKQNTVLFEKNADKKMYPASMTKIITVIVALEMIKDLNAEVEITSKDLETIFETNASAAYFNVGEKVTYKDLIYGAMLPSGADASRALAFNLCGDLETFVKKMNEFAKKLELKGTHFVNTTGIHDTDHYTTAKDLAKIVRYAIDNKDFLEAFSTRSYQTTNGQHTWVNTGIYYAEIAKIDVSRIIGCKSGYTDEALRCLASVVQVDEREVISIVGHSDKEIPSAANQDTNAIAKYCEEKYAVVKLHDEGQTIKDVPIEFGKDANYRLTYGADVIAYLPADYQTKDLKYTYKIEELEAPISKGTKIGNMKMEYQGQVLYSQDFKIVKDLERDTMEYILHQVKSFLFPYGLSICFIIIYILLYRYHPKSKA